MDRSDISDDYSIEYLYRQLEYEKLYGEKTVVFMQCGTFYNVMEYNVQECETEEAKRDKTGKLWDQNIGKVFELYELMECVQTSRNGKKPHTVYNLYSFGFNMTSFDKHTKRALRAGYVVVRFDEITDPKGKSKRVVVDVLNPTTVVDTVSTDVVLKNVVVMYIEYQTVRGHKHYNLPQNFFVTSGVASVDLITGKATIADFFNRTEDKAICLERLYQFLIATQPRELIIYLHDFPAECVDDYGKYLERVLEVSRYERVVIRKNEFPNECAKISYQVEFFNKLFNQTRKNEKVLRLRNDRIIEHLGLEKVTYGRIAYILLMNHQVHNKSVTVDPQIPSTDWLDAKSRMILSHNALIQLNIIPVHQDKIGKSKEIDSLYAVLDHNCTNIGRRMLRDLLIMPMTHHDEINKYYEMIDEALTCQVKGLPLYHHLDRKLKELPDIERLLRKLQNRSLAPRELAVLNRSFSVIVEIYCSVVEAGATKLSEDSIADESVSQFNDFLDVYNKVLNPETLEICTLVRIEKGLKILDFKASPFKPGIYPELDTKYQRLLDAESHLEQIADHLNTFLALKSREKKLVVSRVKRKPGKALLEEPSAVIITTTQAKASKLLKSDYDLALCGKLEAVKHNANDKLITSPVMDGLYEDVAKIRSQLRRDFYDKYLEILDEMNHQYTFYGQIVSLIGKLDLIHSYAKITKLYGYHRPVIDDDETKTSYLEATSLRHPISERLVTGEYITNDIFLGVASDHPKKTGGMVVKGQNGAGKTTLTKAVALNIVMAQCGCYTSSYLKYVPYKTVFTRLSTSDNIIKGSSSFCVEISELITMIRQYTINSLCILDEVTRGSDIESGISITTAALECLVETKASFLLATHIHNLQEIPSINRMGCQELKFCHLSLERDPVSGLIIYDRKLKDGDGTSCYGILVAESLGMPDHFVRRAYEILNYIQKTEGILSTKKSHFNGNVHIDCCSRCGSKEGLHSHHIKHQSEADEHGLIGSMHMNVQDNLLPLCEKCHLKGVHHDGMVLKNAETLHGKAVIITS
ncbi:DNA mismatch repair ATPase [uncultured virus]|nr:DNA mismatch repair ATPase [uncultured virus]